MQVDEPRAQEKRGFTKYIVKATRRGAGGGQQSHVCIYSIYVLVLGYFVSSWSWTTIVLDTWYPVPVPWAASDPLRSATRRLASDVARKETLECSRNDVQPEGSWGRGCWFVEDITEYMVFY